MQRSLHDKVNGPNKLQLLTEVPILVYQVLSDFELQGQRQGTPMCDDLMHGEFLRSIECFLRCCTFFIHLDPFVFFNGCFESKWPKHCRDGLGPLTFCMEKNGSGGIAR